MLHRREQLLPADGLKFRMRRGKSFDLPGILLRFDAAGAVDKLPARRDAQRSRLQNLILKFRDPGEFLLTESPQRIRTPAENARIGTRHIRQNQIKTPGQLPGLRNDDRKRKPATAEILARELLPPGGKEEMCFRQR